jgi:hypothetical protein
MADRVWELASLPKSYWDESDPEAATPNASPAKFGSPVGGAYLEDSGDESYADHELNFSVDSPNKVPVVTYTTEEEEASETTSTSPATTVRQFDHSIDSSSGLSYQGDVENSMAVSTLGDSVSLTKFDAETSPVNTSALSGPHEQDKSVIMPRKKEVIVAETVVSTSSDSSGDLTAIRSPKPEATTEFSSPDHLSMNTSDEQDDEIATPKTDVFYTPPQPQRTETLALVAKTIVNQVDIYDEATRRWAQRVLEVMSSPTPKLLAAEPHHHSP